MKAEEKALKFLTMEGRVKIPFFQRTYVWDENNWEDLLEEFLDKEKINNFLGAIILKQLPSKIGEPEPLEVIDGQQRLVTLSIFLKALYDSFSDEVKENVKSGIFDILFYKKDYTSSDYGEVRIENSRVDSEYYRKVIKNSESLELDKIDEDSHKILRCYKFFRERFAKLSEEEKKDLLNKRILNTANEMLVVIGLNENDDEQAIFDTLNTAGVRLTSAEIIKNALFKKLIELSSKEDAINAYEKTWGKTFEEDEETLQYWETELTTGRMKRQNIEILLHSIGVIEGFYDPDKHILSDLSKLYKEKINEYQSSEELKRFIEKIIEYAEIYKENIYDFDKSDTFSFSDDIEGIKIRLLHILNVLDISTFHPFILYVMKEYSNDKQETLLRVLRNLEKFVIQNAVANVISVKNYNKLCKQFIEKPEKLEGELENVYKGSIEGGLKRISNKLASLILFWIELYRHKDERSDISELKYVYSLEHIMPVKWRQYWNFDKVPHPNNNLNDKEKEEDRNEKIYWIGNMTLLKSRLNSALRNYEFEKKVNGEGRKKGMRHYAELRITKEIIEQFDKGDKIWNEGKIVKRTINLTDEFNKIWG